MRCKVVGILGNFRSSSSPNKQRTKGLIIIIAHMDVMCWLPCNRFDLNIETICRPRKFKYPPIIINLVLFLRYQIGVGLISRVNVYARTTELMYPAYLSQLVTINTVWKTGLAFSYLGCDYDFRPQIRKRQLVVRINCVMSRWVRANCGEICKPSISVLKRLVF